MSLNHKSQELRTIEKQVEELRVLNFKLSEQLKEISKSKKSKNLTEKMTTPATAQTIGRPSKT